MKTLLVGPIHEEAHNLLQQNTELQEVSVENFPNSTYPETEAIVLRTYTELKESQLNLLPKLKYVVSCSVGLNNLDLDLLKERNIELLFCPGSNANSVAEHTLFLMLSLLRQEKPFPEMKGKTVGIIGLGYIGKLVARKLLGFGAKVVAFDVIEQDPVLLEELKVEMKSFEEVAKSADILTVHVPLNKHTANLISDSVFSNMKEGSFFVNTSREEVIDEASLLNHYSKFKGNGLDVFSDNLKTNLQEKTSLQGNLIFTNHVAAQGEDSFKEMCLRPVKLLVEKIMPN